MAGRGTDIMRGGNPEFIADLELHQRGLSPVETPEDYEKAWPEAVEKAKRAVAEEHEEVVGLGGLYVLGTERHESRRIDNQLRGRSGRQGDPGMSRFYLSLEDDLMRMFNADKVAHFMEWLKTPPDVPIESKAVSRSIRSAQTQVEQQNFEIRKDVLKYDDVLNRQRHVIYGERREVLEGADLHEQIRQMIDEVVTAYVTGASEDGFPEEWDLDRLWTAFGELYHPKLTIDDVIEEAGGERAGLSRDFLVEVQENPIVEDAANGGPAAPPGLRQAPPDRPGQRPAPAAGGPAAGNATGNGAPRGRHAAGNRGQRAAGAQPGGGQPGGARPDGGQPGGARPGGGQPGGARPGGGQPGGGQPGAGTPSVVAPGLSRPQRSGRLSYSAPSADGGGQVERRTESADGGKFAKVGRNAPCPCGSGRKYKLCHGDPRNRASG